MTVNGYDVGRASVGTSKEASPHMTREVMADGSVKVRKTGPADRLILFKLTRMTNTQFETLAAMLAAMEYAAATMTVVDDYGTSYSCRYWGNSFVGQSRLGRFWSVDFVVRLEA